MDEHKRGITAHHQRFNVYAGRHSAERGIKGAAEPVPGSLSPYLPYLPQPGP